MAADHELPWPPEHATPKRGRPNFDAAWVRAVQRRLLAGGDFPSDATGKGFGWWQLGMDVDKMPLELEEEQAVTPCAEQVDVATTSCAIAKSEDEGAFLPSDFAGDNRPRKQWSMAHSLRVARHLCRFF